MKSVYFVGRKGPFSHPWHPHRAWICNSTDSMI